VSPKLRSLLARVVLIGGIAGVASYMARSAPHDQTVAVRLNSRQVARVSGIITRQGDSEPTAGFSQDFVGASPSVVRHTFSAPNDTYIVVITLHDKPRLAPPPTKTSGTAPTTNETSFERRVSLVGSEQFLSPE
jgi:hypothetical protein